MAKDGVNPGSAPKIDLATGVKKPKAFIMQLVMLALGLMFGGFFFARGSTAGKSGKGFTQTVKEGISSSIGVFSNTLGGAGLSK